MAIADSLGSCVLLVGSGQLGSRYLQGLTRIDHQLNIFVVDPSKASLDLARQRLIELPFSAQHQVNFAVSLDKVPFALDLAIIVTPANCRADVVSAIVERHQVKAWILEKVLAQSSHKVSYLESILNGYSKVWVNTPRRLMAWHKAIRSEILPMGPSPLQVRVRGGSWGLACNAIHFIDLVAWWSQASVQSLNPAGLGDWVQSKRAGFHEVLGSLWVTYADGSELELCCNSGTEPTQFTVVTPQGEWVIEESAGRVTGPNGHQLSGQLIFQSALTAPLVKQILQEGCCALPTLAESAAQHRPLLKALLEHWNRSHGRHDCSVPIT